MDNRSKNVLVLAYLGDSVYELSIRKFLVLKGISNVKELQQKYKDIYLIAYLPYQKKLFSKEIAGLLPCCKEICVAEIENQKGCYHLRNRYMIEHSSLLIAVTDGKQGGGTDYTIKYGQKMGIHIEKIYF